MPFRSVVRSGAADRGAGVQRIAYADRQGDHAGQQRGPAAAMVDDDDLAIAFVIAGEADAAGGRRDDLAAGAGGDGDAARSHPAFVHLAQPGDDARSEEHTSELQSLMRISYAVFCLKKKTRIKINKHISYSITTSQYDM